MTGLGLLLMYVMVNLLVDNVQNPDSEKLYLDSLFASQPQPSLQQRRLSHIHDIHRKPPHMKLYNLSQSVPQESNFTCVTSKTSPSFQVCTYEPHKDKYISGALLTSGVWEPYITDIFQKALTKCPEALVIDVGANIGYYSLLAARMGHQVIAAEPSLDNVLRLHRAVQLNRLQGKIHLIFNAISDGHENVTLSQNADNQGGLWVKSVRLSGRRRTSDTVVPSERVIHTTTLDHVLEITDSSQAIIKLDIEGFECKALAGARRLLKKVFVPYIFMEWRKMFINRNHQGSSCPKAAMRKLTEYLVRLGYIPYEVHTGFQLDPKISTVHWRIGDLYWRHKLAKVLQDVY